MIKSSEIRRYRIAITLFIAGLVVSGLTAFPLQWELDLLVRTLGYLDQAPESLSPLGNWLLTVKQSIDVTYDRFPWIGYGTDWLAFGHLVIAMFFVVPAIQPVGHRWVILTGLVACAAVFPVALIGGAVRQIPLWWRIVDCSFGVVGGGLLLYALGRDVFEVPPDRGSRG